MENLVVAQPTSSATPASKSGFSQGVYISLNEANKYVTWKDFPSHFDVEFSWLRASGKNIGTLIEESNNNEWKDIFGLYRAHILSCQKVNLKLSELAFHKILPDFLLIEYLDMLNQLTSYVWENFEINPKLYHSYKKAHLTSLLAQDYKVRLDLNWINNNLHSSKVRKLKGLQSRLKIKYDIFGTKTGRFTTKPDSFPILTLNKELRRRVVPNNDLFVVFDYNAAEMRTFLSLSGRQQPEQDLHEWNKKNIFKNQITRKESKVRFFSWLYDNHKSDKKLDSMFDRKKVLEKFWDGSEVRTDFGRNISSNSFKALNHLIQSSTNDLIIDSTHRALEKYPLLKNRFAFMIHDSIILDCKKSDAHMLQDFRRSLQDTKYGNYLCSFHLGKDLLNLKEVS